MKREHFDAWKKDPVTIELFGLLRKAAEQDKAEWLRLSWDGGEANPLALCELRTRAHALTELADNDFETWTNWSDDGDPTETDD